MPKFEGRVEYEEWKELVIDWMETDGKKLVPLPEYLTVIEGESVRGHGENGK